MHDLWDVLREKPLLPLHLTAGKALGLNALATPVLVTICVSRGTSTENVTVTVKCFVPFVNQ